MVATRRGTRTSPRRSPSAPAPRRSSRLAAQRAAPARRARAPRAALAPTMYDKYRRFRGVTKKSDLAAIRGLLRANAQAVMRRRIDDRFRQPKVMGAATAKRVRHRIVDRARDRKKGFKARGMTDSKLKGIIRKRVVGQIRRRRYKLPSSATPSWW